MRVTVPEYNTFVDFPDDLDPAEIERVLAEQFPSKQASAEQRRMDLQRDPGTPTAAGPETYRDLIPKDAPVATLEKKPFSLADFAAGAVASAAKAVPIGGARTMAGVGGIIQGAGESAARARVNPQTGEYEDPGSTMFGVKTGRDPEVTSSENLVTDIGRNVSQEYSKRAQEVLSWSKDGWEKHLTSALASGVQSMITIPLSVIAPGLSLAAMGAVSAGDAYAGLRAAGVEIPRAAIASAGNGVVEVATEKLPLEILLKQGTSFMRKMVGELISEEIGETTATTLQTAMEMAAKNPRLTWEEYKREVIPAIKDTLIETPIAAGAQVGGYRAAEYLQDRTTKKPVSEHPMEQQVGENLGDAAKATEAGPGPAPEPPPGAPPTGGVSTQPKPPVSPPAAEPATAPAEPTTPPAPAPGTDLVPQAPKEMRGTVEVPAAGKESEQKKAEQQAPPRVPSPVDVFFQSKMAENIKDPEPASEGYIRRQAEREAPDHLMKEFYSPQVSGEEYQRAVWDWSKKNNQDIARADLDIGHLSGMNEDERVGHDKANEHLRAMSTIIHRAFKETLPDAELIFTRHGGDELAVDAIGVPKELLDKAAQEAKIRVEAYARENGLLQLTSKKGITKDVSLHVNVESRAAFDSFEKFKLFNDAKRAKEKLNESGRNPQAARPEPPERKPETPEQGARQGDGEERAARASEPAGKAEPSSPGEVGRKSTAKTVSGTTVPVRLEALDAGDLILSHDAETFKENPSYPQDLQGRNRASRDYSSQISDMEKKLDPTWLGDTKQAWGGAPIVGPEGFVESGNGRGIVLNRLYARNSPQAKAYKQWLVENAENFGLDPEKVRQMERPVLVRRRLNDFASQEDRVKWTEESNEEPGSKFSASEQARRDAKKITPDFLALLQPNADGSLTAASNRAFMRKFQSEVITPGEQKGYVKDDELNAAGILRVQNAVLAMAYEDIDILEVLTEDPAGVIGNIKSAMIRAAAPVAAMKRDVKAGKVHKDLWPGKELLEAVRTIDNLRREGTNVDEWIKNEDAFRDKLVSQFVEVINKYKRSAKNIGNLLIAYTDVVREAGNPRQEDIFGGTTLPTKEELLQAAYGLVQEGYDGQTSFFFRKDGDSSEDDETSKGPLKDATDTGHGKARARKPPKGSRFEVGEGKPTAYDEAAATRKRGALDTAEIARLIKKLTGEYPQLRPGIIRTATSIVNGFYSPATGKITVTEKTAEIEAFVRRVLAHELGHRIHHIGPKETMLRGNILGIIAAFERYVKHTLPEYPGARDDTITPQEREKFRREAEREARAERREFNAAQESPEQPGARRVSPDEIKAIWNDVAARERDPELYEYIAKLSAEQKKSILRDAMRGVSNVELQRQIESTPYFDLNAKTRDLYREKIKEEIRKRKLYELETITEELKGIVRTVKPFNEQDPGLVKHYFKATELYADGVSMILIDPDYAKSAAPTFYKAFFSYMENRPEVKAEYDEVLRLTEGSRKDLLESFSKEARKWSDEHEIAMKAEIDREKYTFLDTVLQKFWTFYRPLSKKAAQWEKKLGRKLQAGSDPRVWMRSMALRNSAVYAFAAENHEKIMQRLLDAGWSREDLSYSLHEYMLYMRAAYELESIPKVKTISVNGMPVEVEEERSDKALPGGLTKARAAEQIDHMKDKLGAEKFGQLQKAYEDFQAIWQSEVVSAVEEAGLWSQDLLNYAKDNKYYAKFQTIAKVNDLMDVGYGRAVTTHVYRRHGSFQEVANTWANTVLTGASLIRAAHINTVKKNIVASLLTHEGPNVIRPAAKRWNGKFHEIEIVENENWGTVVFLQDGKPRGFYVEREISDILNRRPEAASRWLNAANMIMAPFKMLLVTLNPGWHVSNVLFRDPAATFKNLPEASNPMRLLRAYVSTFRDAARAAFHDELTPAIKGMYKRRELYAGVSWSPWESKDLDQLDALNARFGISDVQYKNRVLRSIVALHEHAHRTPIGRKLIRAVRVLNPNRVGKFEEVWAKAAGSRLLQESIKAGERSQLEASDIVASRVGTPHLFDAGEWRSALNNLFFFSGVNVSGKKAMFRSWKDNPTKYALKTMALNVLPAAAQVAASTGMLALAAAMFAGDDEDEAKKKAREAKAWWSSISSYQRKHYINIPLGMTENGKSVSFTLPMDYEGQLIYALTWSILSGNFGKRGILADLKEQWPWSWGTPWSLVWDMKDAYISDTMPIDEYRNKPAIHPDAFEAGGTDKLLELAKYEANQLGLSWIYRFNTDDPAKVKSRLEEAFDVPGGGFFQRFVRVSDYGIREEAADVADQVGRKKAKKRWEMRKVFRDDIRSYNGKPDEEAPYRLYQRLVDEGKIDPAYMKPGQFRRQYERHMIPGLDSARLENLERADTDTKVALMDKYRNEMIHEQFNILEQRALDEGILKKLYWKKTEAEKGGEQ